MAIDEALSWVAGGGTVGGALGAVGAAFNGTSVIPAVENGASVGTGVVIIGALVVALANERARDTALETAGVGCGALIVGALISKLASATVSSPTTTTTPSSTT
jgi:hypothetical protein